MGWTPHWTEGAWNDIRWLQPTVQEKLFKAVKDFASTGRGRFVSDGPGMGLGRLIVGNYEIDVARVERHTFLNEDGEEVAILDAIVVLAAVAKDPNP